MTCACLGSHFLEECAAFVVGDPSTDEATQQARQPASSQGGRRRRPLQDNAAVAWSMGLDELLVLLGEFNLVPTKQADHLGLVG